jgi:hypothetical protein
MKTSELVEALTASDNSPIRPLAPVALLAPAACLGAAVSASVLAIWLGFQPLALAARAPWFWMKWGYAVSAALAGLAIVVRLSRPGRRAGWLGLAVIGGALAAIWLMAMRTAMRTGAADQAGLWLGHTWMVCPWRILILAAPIWLAATLAMRRLAPTRLSAAGAAAGLLAGGLSALVYGLYCQETAAPFVAVWYSLGIAASAGVGWLLGPRVLRW